MKTKHIRIALEEAEWPSGWDLAILPIVPLAPIVIAFVTFGWAWDRSFAHSFLSDWFRFWRRATLRSLAKATFWPNSGWFYNDGRIVWSWNRRAHIWKDFGGAVNLASH